MTRARGKRRCLKKPWTTAEDRILRRRYPHESTVDIAKDLGRSLSSVYQRAYGRLKLHKTATYMASPHAYRFRRGVHAGWAHRFQKGHVPANKGLRRPGWGPGRMKATQFKAGQRSGTAARNWMPVGSTRWFEGYLLRKVSDIPNVAYTVNWQPEHRLVWERAHGPVPTGYRLRFLNGDPSDIRLDNLTLVTPAEMMQRNTVHRLPKALKQVIQLRGALNRQIRQRDQEKRKAS